MVPGGRIFQMFGNLGLFHRKYEFCHSSHGIVLCKVMLGIIVAAHSYSMIFYLPLILLILDRGQ